MNPERLLRRWRRRHARLLLTLPDLLCRSRARGAPEDVHQLRVAVRRLRLLVRLGKRAFAAGDVARLRAWGAKVSEATSPVRDLDIAVEWLRASKVSPGLVEECETRREGVWRRRRRLLPRKPAWLASQRVFPARGRRLRDWLPRRHRKLEHRFREEVRQGLPRFYQLGETDRHELRRVIRWWRYLREFCLPKRRERNDPLLERLLNAQEALGTLQNLALVAVQLQRLTPSAELNELRGLLARQEEDQLATVRVALAALRTKLR